MDRNADPRLQSRVQSNTLCTLPAPVVEHISAFLPWTSKVCLYVTCQELHAILRARLASHKQFLRHVARTWHCRILAVQPSFRANPSWADLERRACQLHSACLINVLMTIHVMLAPLMAVHAQQLRTPDSLDSKLVVRAYRAYQILSPMWDKSQHDRDADRQTDTFCKDACSCCGRECGLRQRCFLSKASEVFARVVPPSGSTFPFPAAGWPLSPGHNAPGSSTFMPTTCEVHACKL